MANKDKSIMDHLAAAKSALATAEMHGQVLAATFPDTFLAGVRLAGWLATDCLFKNSGAATKSRVVSTTNSNSIRSIKTAH